MDRKQNKNQFVWEKKYNSISLVWVSTPCESKIEKQDLQAGETWWQNSNNTTSYIQERKNKRNRNRDMN